MEKADFADIWEKILAEWPFGRLAGADRRRASKSLGKLTFDPVFDAIESHKREQGNDRSKPNRPNFDRIATLAHQRASRPKSEAQVDFGRWFLGLPPHHEIDGLSDSTAVRVRRLFYQRDHDRGRIESNDYTERLGPDRLHVRIGMVNDQLERIRAAKPDCYQRGASSYAESRHRIETQADIAASWAV